MSTANLSGRFLLAPGQTRALEGLRWNPRRTFPGRVRGERLTRRRGISIDFADYREYTAGDDLRHLDWNVLARLGHPIVKTYQDEEDLAVHLLVDCSASMGFGAPSKFSVALRWAAALGCIGLAGSDAVHIHPLGLPVGNPKLMRGRGQYPRLDHELSQLGATSKVGLAASLRAFAASGARVGVAVILSDGLDPEVATAMKILAGRGHEIYFLQILSALDLDPDLEGDLRLIDAETGSATEITANSPTLRTYRENIARHNQRLAEVLLSVGGHSAVISTNDPFETVVRDVLKRQGWVT